MPAPIAPSLTRPRSRPARRRHPHRTGPLLWAARRAGTRPSASARSTPSPRAWVSRLRRAASAAPPQWSCHPARPPPSSCLTPRLLTGRTRRTSSARAAWASSTSGAWSPAPWRSPPWTASPWLPCTNAASPASSTTRSTTSTACCTSHAWAPGGPRSLVEEYRQAGLVWAY